MREVGPGATGLTSGQRVAAYTGGGGGLAEVVLVPAGYVAPVPDHVTLQVAAAAPSNMR